MCCRDAVIPPASNRRRATTIRLVEERIEDLKERLRLTHDLGQQLVAEIVRLEEEKRRYIEHSERPVLILRRSA